MRNSKLRISADKKLILPEINGVFWGEWYACVWGAACQSQKKKAVVWQGSLEVMTTAPCAHSLILCNLIKPSNCRRYLTGIIFPLPFLMEGP